MKDEQILQNWNTIKELLLSTKRSGIENLVEWLDKSDFKTAPASTKYHGSYKGGLADHSLNTYYSMYNFSSLINFFALSEDTIKITALLHDICKVFFYETSTRNVKENNEWKTVPFFTVKDQFPVGHAEKSIMLIQSFIKLTSIEIAMIRNHMGFAKDEPLQVTSLFNMYPESLILHFADMTATFINESNDLDSTLKSMLVGRNISESIKLLNERDNIEIDGHTYKLALPNAIVDGKKVIEVNDNNQKYKVLSPHKDGLPF